MAARGIPMLFMGEEFLEDKQWDDAVQLFPNLLINWAGLRVDRTMQDYLEFAKALIGLRRAHPALGSEQLRVSTADSFSRVMAIHRWIVGFGGHHHSRPWFCRFQPLTNRCSKHQGKAQIRPFASSNRTSGQESRRTGTLRLLGTS